LRLELADRARVDRDALKRLGARGTVDTGASGLQVVVGPMADGIASDIRAHLASGGGGVDAQPLLDALGGRTNVTEARARGGRLLVTLRDPDAVDKPRLEAAAPRGVAYPTRERVHILHGQPGYLIPKSNGTTVIGASHDDVGFDVRNTAGGIATFAGVMFVLPPLMNVLPTSWNSAASPYLPLQAGEALISLTRGNQLAPWTGFGVLCAYAAASLAIAAVLLVRRDV
jgi:phosphotransferase system IIB component